MSGPANDLSAREPYDVTDMGFGSYDESEQENQEYDTDYDEEDAVNTSEADHEGEVSFDFDESSSDELLDQYKSIKEDD